jgi:threonine aldolase
LVCVEDTSNIGGGAVIPPSHLAKVAAVARRHSLPIHMDGARFFNAVVASGLPAREFTRHCDTLSFCLSKGLGAPFGALLCGSKEAVQRALAYRQMLGGGMRQAGVMAAAGVVAMETGISRLAEDHANAKRLAQGLAERFPGSCDPTVVETNLFHISVAAFGVSGQQIADHLASEGILVFAGEPRMRLATHCMITSHDIDETLEAFDRLGNT